MWTLIKNAVKLRNFLTQYLSNNFLKAYPQAKVNAQYTGNIYEPTIKAAPKRVYTF